MKKANFLILDEPTNHLDLDAKEVLESALINYPGTILFVSHDRYFLNRVATRVAELEQGQLISYIGDYDYYLEKKEDIRQRRLLQEQETNAQAETRQQRDKQSFELDKESKSSNASGCDALKSSNSKLVK